jgi:hypothetical protein
MKKNLPNILLSALLLTFISFSLFAQSNKISGNVQTETGNPIIGASVIIKGSNKGTTTDASGNFSLEINQNNILVFSSVGFLNKEVAVKGQSNLTILLIENNKDLDEIIVTGCQQRPIA